MMARETTTPKKVKSQGLMRSIVSSGTVWRPSGIHPRRVRPSCTGTQWLPDHPDRPAGNAGPRAAILWSRSLSHHIRPRISPPVTIERLTQCPAGNRPISSALNS